MTIQQSDGASYVLGLRILGSDFRLEFTREESRDLAASAWSRCVVSDLADDARVVTLPDADEALTVGRLSAITSSIVRDASSRLEGSRLVIRAFGLADADGRVILIAGNAGPDALDQILDLARREWGYVSDEVLAIGDDLSVLPCPRPLTIPDEGVHAHHRTLRGPDDLGLLPCPEALRLARIVWLEPIEDGEGAALERMTLLDTLTALSALEETHAPPVRLVQRLAAMIERAGGGLRLAYSDGADIRGALESAIANPDGAREHWMAITERPANPMAWGLRDGRIRQKPFVDAVETAEGALVLAGHRPLRLGPLGFTLWQGAREEATADQLMAQATAEHGDHPHARRLVRAAIEEMTGSGAVATANPLGLSEFLSGSLRASGWR